MLKITSLPTSLAPWLSVRNAASAVAFYQTAFSAQEVFHLEDPDGNVVSRLAIGSAEFWVSDESPAYGNFSPATLGGTTVRLILTVADPDSFFARALSVGAREISPVTDEHGWRMGRLVDPFEHTWEIGRPLD